MARNPSQQPAPGRRSRPLFIALPSLLALLAGCGTPSNPYFPPTGAVPGPEPAPTATTPQPETVTLTEPITPMMAHDLEEAVPPQFNTAPPPAPPSRWGNGWIPLDAWISAAGASRPQRTTSGNSSRYTIQTRTGTCTLTIGSRVAHWNGTPVWLGFPPRISNGQPQVNSIDAERTLLPLAEPLSIVNAAGRTVVIDPGHGGVDSGTRGARGEREKDYTLDWALRVEQRLTNAGWNVVLTRRSDMDVPLPNRIAIADAAKADLFLSLHFNSAHPNVGPAGIETYCLTPSGTPSTLLRGYADDTRVNYANNAFDPLNIQYAYQIHRELIAQTRAADNGLKHARFMSVLRYQQRPAILVEGGFLSNPAELDRIRSTAYRDALADAIARALGQ